MRVEGIHSSSAVKKNSPPPPPAHVLVTGAIEYFADQTVLPIKVHKTSTKRALVTALQSQIISMKQ